LVANSIAPDTGMAVRQLKLNRSLRTLVNLASSGASWACSAPAKANVQKVTRAERRFMVSSYFN
jgi:hypothetical protein